MEKSPERPNKITEISTSGLTAGAMFAALIAVLAQVSIPLPFSPVPFSGQLLGVLLAGSVLQRKAGLLCITAYLLLGAAGAPVFALGRGGIHVLAGPSGGYLWGFLPAVYCLGLITNSRIRQSPFVYPLAMTVALACVYLCGMLQLIPVMGLSINQAFIIGVIPFIPLDIVKTAIAAYLTPRIINTLERNGLGHLTAGNLRRKNQEPGK